jgi:hypothetical protein
MYDLKFRYKKINCIRKNIMIEMVLKEVKLLGCLHKLNFNLMLSCDCFS